jgi:hypothetical protein
MFTVWSNTEPTSVIVKMSVNRSYSIWGKSLFLPIAAKPTPILRKQQNSLPAKTIRFPTLFP